MKINFATEILSLEGNSIEMQLSTLIFNAAGYEDFILAFPEKKGWYEKMPTQLGQSESYLLKKKHRKMLTLGRMAATALTSRTDDDRGISGVDLLKRGQLINRIFGSKGDADLNTVNVTMEDVVLIKDLMRKHYNAWEYWQACQILDPEEAKPKEEQTSGESDGTEKVKDSNEVTSSGGDTLPSAALP